MDFAYFSEYFFLILPPTILSIVLTISGSLWINRLYHLEEDTRLLSFPGQIAVRAKFRKPLLFILLLFGIRKAWLVASIPTVFYFIAAIAFLSFVTITDFEQYVIFDSMLLPFALCGMCYTLHLHLPVTEHLAAGLGGGLLFFLLTLLTKGAIGGGDIKLIAAMGLWLGIRPLLSVIAYGFIAGGIAAFILLLTKQKSRHSYFAYGPYFALSGLGIMLGWLRALI